MSKNIAIYGWYGFRNLGDEAILAGIIKLLKEIDPSIEITVFSNDPQYTSKLHNVRSVHFLPTGIRSFLKGLFDGSFWDSIKALFRCNIFLLGGGGFLSDWQKEAPFVWLTPALFAKLLGKKVVLYGAGAGPFKTSFGRKFSSFVLNKFDYIGVRDVGSQQWLQQIGVTTSINLSGCPSLQICRPKENLPGTKPFKVGVSIAPIFKDGKFWPNRESKYQKMIEAYSELLKFLVVDLKAKVELICMHYPHDSQTFDEVLKVTPRYIFKEISRIDQWGSPFDSIEVFERLDLMIGMRLHSVVLAAGCGVPVIGIAYNPKVSGFFELMGIPELYVTIGDGSLMMNTDINVAALKEKIIDTLEHYNDYCQKLKTKIEEMKLQNKSTIKQVLNS